jgi:hypothetical protein
VEGGDQAGGHTCSWVGALLQQRKRRWSELSWFEPGIKRNQEWAAMVWAGSKRNLVRPEEMQWLKHGDDVT